MRHAVLPEPVVSSWPSLSLRAKAVAGSLARHMDDNGAGCYPSVRTIGEHAGLKTDRSVRRALHELESQGLLTINRRTGASSVFKWAEPLARDNPGTETPGGTRNTGSPPTRNARGWGTETPGDPLHETTPKQTNHKKNKPPSPNGGQVWGRWVDAHRDAGRRDPVTAGPDTAAGKALAKMIKTGSLSEDELCHIMGAYLADEDSFIKKQGHPLRLLSGRMNAYLNSGPEEDPEFVKASEAYGKQCNGGPDDPEQQIMEAEALAAGGAS